MTRIQSASHQQFASAEQWHKQGEWENAIAAYQSCLADAQTQVAAHCNLASIFLQQKNYAAALIHWSWLQEQQPAQLIWREQLAATYFAAGNKQAAITTLKAAIEDVQIHTPELLSRCLDRLAGYYQQDNQFATAIAFQYWAIQSAIQPQAHLYFNLANHYLHWHQNLALDAKSSNLLLPAQQALETAESVCRSDKALPEADKFRTENEIHQLQADIFARQGCWSDALSKILTVKNRTPKVLNRTGVIYSELQQWREAVTYLQQALIIDPDYAAAQYHLANAWSALGNYSQANLIYGQLCQKKPAWADAHLNWGLNLLANGDWLRGWQEYEWRWQVPAYAADILQTNLPAYKQLIAQRSTVLIWSEQGIGDAIMWLPWVQWVERLGVNFVLMIQDRLLPLVQRTYPHWHLLPRRAKLAIEQENNLHAQIPLGSLPLLISGQDPENATAVIPVARPAYLFADANKVAELKNSYGCGLRVGIAWQGGTGAQKNLRSIPLTEWLSFLQTTDVKFFSLQHGLQPDDMHAIDLQTQELLWCDFSIDPLLDLDAFAAQIAAMDLVITVDNSTAHLAGALGIETWVLLPEMPEWRWPRYVEQFQACCWYQSVHLFYKEKNSWSSLLSEVQQYLIKWRNQHT